MAGVTFQRRDFTDTVQPPFEMQVTRMKWSAKGGCDQALIELHGGMMDEAGRYALEALLRCPVMIDNEYGQSVWWGYVQRVEINQAGVRSMLDLSTLANRVAVRYRELAPAGSTGELLQTPWADDLESQALYGVKALLLDRAEMEADAAEQLRDVTLAARAGLHWQLDTQGGKADWQARLICWGWIHTLKWQYVQPLSGLIANTSAQSGTQWLGNTYSDLWLGQSFTPAAAMDIRAVDVRMRREGLPVDEARIQIQTDNAGKPSGTSLGQSVVSPADISADGFPWLRFAFAPPVTVGAGTPLWIVLQRSGQPSQSKYYVVGVDERLSFTGGEFRVYNHVITSWIPRNPPDPPADLLFRVTATQSHSGQIGTLVTEGGQFIDALEMADEPGLESVSYLATPRTAYAQLLALLEVGAAGQRGLLAEVSPERRLVIRLQPRVGEADGYVDGAGHYYDSQHNLLMPGVLPVGQWVRVLGGEGVAFMSEGVCLTCNLTFKI